MTATGHTCYIKDLFIEEREDRQTDSEEILKGDIPLSQRLTIIIKSH